MLSKKIQMFLLFINLTNFLFAYEIKTVDWDSFLRDEESFIQSCVFGNFSLERYKNSFVSGKMENDCTFRSYYFKEDDFFICRIKECHRIDDEKVTFYINDDKLYGTICEIWEDDSWNAKRISLSWNDKADLTMPADDFAEISISTNGNVKKCKLPTNIKELQFKKGIGYKTNKVVISVPNNFSSLKKINFLYINSQDEITVNCNESVEILGL